MPGRDMFDFSETMVLYQVTNSDTENNEAGLQNLIAKGELRAFRSGGTMKFRKADLESLAEEGVLTARNGWERNLAGAERRQKLEELANDPTLTDGQRVLALEDLDNFRSLISDGAETSAGDETVFTDRDLQVLPLDDEPESEAPAARMVDVGTDPDLGVQMEYDDEMPPRPRVLAPGYSNRRVIARTVGLFAAVMGAYAASTIWLIDTAAANHYAKGLEDGAALERRMRDDKHKIFIAGYNSFSSKEWSVQVHPRVYANEKMKPDIAETPAHLKDFVNSSECEAGKCIQEVAAAITKGEPSDSLRARSIYMYLCSEITKEDRRVSKHHDPKNPSDPIYVRHPLETLVERGANDASMAVLAASLLEAQGFETALLYFHGGTGRPPYVAAAVNVQPEKKGQYLYSFPISGKKFYLFIPETWAGGVGTCPVEAMDYLSHARPSPVTAFRVTKK